MQPLLASTLARTHCLRPRTTTTRTMKTTRLMALLCLLGALAASAQGDDNEARGFIGDIVSGFLHHKKPPAGPTVSTTPPPEYSTATSTSTTTTPPEYSTTASSTSTTMEPIDGADCEDEEDCGCGEEDTDVTSNEEIFPGDLWTDVFGQTDKNEIESAVRDQ